MPTQRRPLVRASKRNVAHTSAKRVEMEGTTLSKPSVSVIGAGAWGTALAQSLAAAGDNRVTLWAREADVADGINRLKVNAAFLPGVELNGGIAATTELSEAARADILLMVVPAQHTRSVLADMRSSLKPDTTVVVCSKGLEQASGRSMADVVAETLTDTNTRSQLAVLSGPSFARDVARGLPAALTLACADERRGEVLAERLSSRQMRLYWSSDVIGAELGGAVKNVLAIAAGVVDGKGLGTSAHAALVTRGFAELRRFGLAMGARIETLLGLSGLGDLILTCGSPQSRNMSLGRALGQGERLADILASRTAVTEGVATASAVVQRAHALNIEMPIAEAVERIVSGTQGVDDAVAQLMSRPLKAED